MVSKCVVSYNLLINGVYGGYNPLTNHLLTSWDIQAKNKYSREDRTCTCANKDKVRLYSNNRTAGWQSVIDPHSGHVVAHRHIVSEPCKDKVETIMAAPSLPKVKPGLLIRDDVCHFEAHIKKQCKSCKHMMRTFKSIKYFVVGEFHRVNHKCVTKKMTTTRLKRVRTNMSELFNAWIRRKNFVLNSMNWYSHRFWMQEAISFWNANLGNMPKYITKRSTATTRKRKNANAKKWVGELSIGNKFWNIRRGPAKDICISWTGLRWVPDLENNQKKQKKIGDFMRPEISLKSVFFLFFVFFRESDVRTGGEDRRRNYRHCSEGSEYYPGPQLFSNNFSLMKYMK